MMLLCIRQVPTKGGVETRIQATEHKRQRNNSPMMSPIGPQQREKQKAKHQSKENPHRRGLGKLRWTDARQKVQASPVKKRDIWQMNATRKKSVQTKYIPGRELTAAKLNTKHNQTIQKSLMNGNLS